MPYYKVTENTDGDKKNHLVSAKNPAAALKAVVEPRFSVVVAEPEDLIRLTELGVKCVEAK